MNTLTPAGFGSFVPVASSNEPRQDIGRVPLIRQYLRMAVRRRYAIIGAVAACLLAGLVITLLITPKYTASTTLEISREFNKITDIQGVERDASVGDQEFYQTQYGLLQSSSLSERVARQLRLDEDQSFFAMFGVKSQAPEFAVVNGRYRADGRAARTRVAGAILLNVVSIAPVRLSRLVDIKATSPNPAFSAKVANAWATNFIEATLERRYQATSYARNFLERRLSQLRARLEDSERQLVSYASNQAIINLPGAGGSNGERASERPLLTEDLSTLNTALAQATADRIQVQARFEQAKGRATTESLGNAAINSLRQRRAELAADYQRMLVQFEPEYPSAKALKSQLNQLDASIAREEGRVSSSLETGYREALGREQGLQVRVNELKQSLLDLRRRSIQYNIFQREVDTNRQLYDGLLQRYKEIGVASGVGVNNVAVVDQADVPNRPSSPRLFLNMIISLFAGLVLGGALALALEQAQELIDEPAELTKQFGLPLLGSVPKTNADQTPLEALQDRKSELFDAYLAIQANLQFTTEHGVPRSLSVTSTRPAEGKSTSALAIATTLARGRKRVVLLDGDMRSPSVHHLVGMSHSFGLSNYLSGSDDVASLLVPVESLGLTVMTAGPTPPNAAELLTGERFGKLIHTLLDQFDHVVVDSPPVMGLADAPLIASRVEGVVYAVESHNIRASIVRLALARLASANAHMLGGILTKFVARKSSYGYGYEYGYGYGREGGQPGAAGAN
ncbi:GumC family protein [Sphingomonas sp. MMS12-HWE2-04]|uniref:GumC family protein n=1 Tax=Sphingomonas sp. MMS12-HWE2-04 TaxID=3234199 RepID=UPI00384A5F8E